MVKLLQPKWHLKVKETNHDNMQTTGQLLKIPNKTMINGKNRTNHNIRQIKTLKIIIIKTNNNNSSNTLETISKMVSKIMDKIIIPDKLGWMKNNS